MGLGTFPRPIFLIMKKAFILFLTVLSFACGLAQPLPVCNLELRVGENDSVYLSWDLLGVKEAVLSRSGEEIFDYIGAACVCDFDGAHRYEPNELSPFVGWTVKDISCVPWSTQCEIRIWTGDMDHQELIYSQDSLEVITEEWNTFDVGGELIIEEGVEYWFGCHIYDAVWAFGVSVGGTVPWKSDLMRVNNAEWMSMVEHNMRYNVCVSVTLVSPEGREMKMGNHRGESLTGYRVYRDDDLIADIPYTFQTYFTDTEFTREFESEYCITAVYGDEESEPVCATAMITGVGEETKAYGITIAPNPTNGQVTIMGKCLHHVEVINVLGQHLFSFEGDELRIDLGKLPDGIYFIDVVDDQGKRCMKKVIKE